MLRIKFVFKIDGKIKSIKVGTSKDISQQAISHIKCFTLGIALYFSTFYSIYHPKEYLRTFLTLPSELLSKSSCKPISYGRQEFMLLISKANSKMSSQSQRQQ